MIGVIYAHFNYLKYRCIKVHVHVSISTSVSRNLRFFFTVNKSIKRLVCAEKIAFTSSKDLDILPSEN